MSLPRFISLLKNVRMLVYADPSIPLKKKEVEWIVKKHRYRSVGVSPILLESFEEEERKEFGKKPFVALSHPFKETERLVELLSSFEKGVPAYFWDTLVLSSCYVCPILFVGRESFESVRNLAVCTMTSTSSLPEVEIKRNLRIIGYAVLDFHEKLTSEAYDKFVSASKSVLEGIGIERVDKWVENRMRVISKDGEHRFWRLKEKGEAEERPVISYFDLTPILLKALHELDRREAKELILFISKLPAECKIALGATVSFVFEI